MLKIEVVNLKEVYELVGDMRDKIDAFAPIGGDSAMSLELFNWQAEDMRRQFPEVEEPDPWTAVAHIYPRSRKDRPHQPARPHARARRARRPLLRIRRQSPGAKRPILRPILFDRLCARMQRLMEEKLTWR
jgi:hypothetical protein